MKIKELKPIRDMPEQFDKLMLEILKRFRKDIYLPLMRELEIESKTITNASSALLRAIQNGQITYYRGSFTGRLNSTLSRELRDLGAVWDRTQGSWKIPQSKLPIDVRNAVSISRSKFSSVTNKIIQKISGVNPAKVAESVKSNGVFDATLSAVENKFQQNIKDISIAPSLSKEERKRIADEYTNNLNLYISDFTEKEMAKLRANVIEASLNGFRYENLAKEIEASYEVSKNKAKFLARQETTLMMTKYAQLRYEDAGVMEYRWNCVKMPHQGKNAPYLPGEVRHDHAIHDGKIFRWDNPPVVNAKGDRKNPGQDFNCRCIAIPIARF